ncbi:LADA_0B05732g1_1 [Lachancea dasiensis]|uniref:LADA_0B05732g1_1 n=1 Tax=Lachancea dasiensis TaxID=1072105 RepID=A0A1G4IU40_9SACH|nr:LADA_0B05732g1_1 [Lachancea dasiensis]
MALQDIKEEEDQADDVQQQAEIDLSRAAERAEPSGVAKLDSIFDEGGGVAAGGALAPTTEAASHEQAQAPLVGDVALIPDAFSASQEALLPPLPEDSANLASPPTTLSPALPATPDSGPPNLASSRSTSTVSSVSRAPSVVRRNNNNTNFMNNNHADFNNVSTGTNTLTGSPFASPKEPLRSDRETRLSGLGDPLPSGVAFDLGTTLEIPHGTEPDSSFDLSKALEIPNGSAGVATTATTTTTTPGGTANTHIPSTINGVAAAAAAAAAATLSTNSMVGSNSNGNSTDSTSAIPLSPQLTSPKLSFKRKFSSTLLPATSSSNLAGTNPTHEGPSTPEFSLHHLQRHGSVRSRTATTDVPRLGSQLDVHAGLGIDHPNLDSNTSPFATAKVLMRKFSIGSSGSSSRSLPENEEALFKPPPNFTSDVNSFTSLHDLKSPRSSLNLAEAAANQNHPKVPLLKRASSAILRKASVAKKSPTSPKYTASPEFQDLRRTASFSTVPYDSNRVISSNLHAAADDHINTSTTTLQRMMVKNKHHHVSTRCISNPEGLHFANSRATSPENRSFGSRVKSGLTRIMSGSNVDKTSQQLHGDPSGGKESQKDTSKVECTPDSISVASPRHSAHWQRIGALCPPRSASSSSGQQTTDPEKVFKKGQWKQNTTNLSMGSAATARNDSVFSHHSDSSFGQGSESDELTIDIDELTKALPAITITDKLGAKNVTPIQTQSNVLLDLVSKENSGQRNMTSQNKSGEEKPIKISLKEYIDVLIKQQHIEDERFAVLEKNFATNGWCSQDDLHNIQQKRMIINKKWAERISHYQSRLEA